MDSNELKKIRNIGEGVTKGLAGVGMLAVALSGKKMRNNKKISDLRNENEKLDIENRRMESECLGRVINRSKLNENYEKMNKNYEEIDNINGNNKFIKKLIKKHKN